MSLYTLTDDMNILYDLLDAAETDEDFDMFYDTFNGAEIEWEQKALRYAELIEVLNSEAEQLKSKAQTLSERAKAKKNKADRLKSSLMQAMVSANRKTVENDLFKVSIRNNSPRLFVENEEAMMEWLKANRFDDCIITHTLVAPEKNNIKQLIRGGAEIPGCSLEASQSLIIK